MMFHERYTDATKNLLIFEYFVDIHVEINNPTLKDKIL